MILDAHPVNFSKHAWEINHSEWVYNIQDRNTTIDDDFIWNRATSRSHVACECVQQLIKNSIN